MNNRQKHLEEQEKKDNIEYEYKKKEYNEKCIWGSLMLFICCIVGTARGINQSVLQILMDSPSKSLPYLIINTVVCIVGYIFIRLTGPKKKT